MFFSWTCRAAICFMFLATILARNLNPNTDETHREKRELLTENGTNRPLHWNKCSLKYCFLNFSTNASEELKQQYKDAFEAAVKLFTDACPGLEVMEQGSGEGCDITVTFKDNLDTDECPNTRGLTGVKYKDGTITAAGICFDETETWVFKRDVGEGEIDFMRIAAHEIAHALGLEHNEGEGSILVEEFPLGDWNGTLSETDIMCLKDAFKDCKEGGTEDGEGTGDGGDSTGGSDGGESTGGSDRKKRQDLSSVRILGSCDVVDEPNEVCQLACRYCSCPVPPSPLPVFCKITCDYCNDC